MIVKIVDINGGSEDINSRFNHPDKYSLFLEKLKPKLIKAYNGGIKLLYSPNLKDKPETEALKLFTPEESYKHRFSELQKEFPFLQGLEDINMTVVPNGIYAIATFVEQIDKSIRGDRDGVVIVGGKYLTACVAAHSKSIRARHPDKQVYIGSDISFDNGFPKIEGYHSIPITTLERHLF
jgi:hypothetical protein